MNDCVNYRNDIPHGEHGECPGSPITMGEVGSEYFYELPPIVRPKFQTVPMRETTDAVAALRAAQDVANPRPSASGPL